ncbi:MULTISPECIES: Flp family type IVb pilin [Burkholderia cepacia complex]|uniref:Flp family type IVb pilin n=2 Tax=Burkholderia cepacia complex TaxID=87882 RepID=A0ABZ3BL23_BURPY|nr:Flp family type IVb pilin [Burkholderia stabilis]BAX57445.1 hypothetical protein BSFP_002330 [Burkholderia stabilis]
MKAMMIRFLREEDGVTAIEYGLIAGLVAIGIVTALGTLEGGLTTLFTNVGNKLTSAAG